MANLHVFKIMFCSFRADLTDTKFSFSPWSTSCQNHKRMKAVYLSIWLCYFVAEEIYFLHGSLILNLKDIYKLQIGKFMYQCKSGLLPDSFNDMFLVTCQVHSYGTRSSELFYLPQCRTNIRKFSISFQGPNFYNSLSPEIRNATSTASFCSKLKAFLLS